tara:strand:+ start:2072 stop:2479 length:408 start_codon:yes stop_codon:yes gene_type:complete
MTAKTSTRKPPVAGTVPAIAKSGTPGKRGDNGIDLDELAGYAEMFTSVEDAAALLSIGAAALQALLDDPEMPHAAIWRQGRARARLNVRRAQFELMAKNATLAVHLGKELLGQDGTAAGGPVTFVVDTGIQRDDG